MSYDVYQLNHRSIILWQISKQLYTQKPKRIRIGIKQNFNTATLMHADASFPWRLENARERLDV